MKEDIADFIRHELFHVKYSDEPYEWNEEFITEDKTKIDYKKMCIKLLEQILEKMEE